MENLTKENYVTNHDYLSYSRVSRFIRCEAAASVGYHDPTTTAQLVGSYIDAYFSNELEQFKEEHIEIFNSKTGGLKKEYQQAEELIKRMEADELFMRYMSGEKQTIMSGEISGVKFKIKMDSYLKDEAIVDLKVMKDFNKVWSDVYRSYMNFVEAYDYDIEMAIFQEIVYQNTGKRLPCYLACITKQDPSDIGIFQIPQSQLDKALQIVKNNLPRILDIIEGRVAPHRCETCNYCRMTKKARVLNFEYAGYDGDKLREEGIESDNPKIIKEV